MDNQKLLSAAERLQEAKDQLNDGIGDAKKTLADIQTQKKDLTVGGTKPSPGKENLHRRLSELYEAVEAALVAPRRALDDIDELLIAVDRWRDAHDKRTDVTGLGVFPKGLPGTQGSIANQNSIKGLLTALRTACSRADSEKRSITGESTNADNHAMHRAQFAGLAEQMGQTLRDQFVAGTMPQAASSSASAVIATGTVPQGIATGTVPQGASSSASAGIATGTVPQRASSSASAGVSSDVVVFITVVSKTGVAYNRGKGIMLRMSSTDTIFDVASNISRSYPAIGEVVNAADFLRVNQSVLRKHCAIDTLEAGLSLISEAADVAGQASVGFDTLAEILLDGDDTSRCFFVCVCPDLPTPSVDSSRPIVPTFAASSASAEAPYVTPATASAPNGGYVAASSTPRTVIATSGSRASNAATTLANVATPLAESDPRYKNYCTKTMAQILYSAIYMTGAPPYMSHFKKFDAMELLAIRVVFQFCDSTGVSLADRSSKERNVDRALRHRFGELISVKNLCHKLQELPFYPSAVKKMILDSSSFTNDAFHHRLLFEESVASSLLCGIAKADPMVMTWVYSVLCTCLTADDEIMRMGQATRVADWGDEAIRVRCGYIIIAVITRVVSYFLEEPAFKNSPVRTAFHKRTAPSGPAEVADEYFGKAIQESLYLIAAIEAGDDGLEYSLEQFFATDSDPGRDFINRIAKQTYGSLSIPSVAVQKLVGSKPEFCEGHTVACAIGVVRVCSSPGKHYTPHHPPHPPYSSSKRAQYLDSSVPCRSCCSHFSHRVPLSVPNLTHRGRFKCMFKWQLFNGYTFLLLYNFVPVASFQTRKKQ